MYSSLDQLHAITPEDVTLTDLQAVFFQNHPDANTEVYTALFTTLAEVKVDAAVGVALLKAMKERKEALSLSEAAFKFSTGRGDRGDIDSAYNKFVTDVEKKAEFEFITDDLESLLRDTVSKHGLRWRLDFLNKSMGSLRKGDFGFLFARPETGKTTFLASEISYMLQNLPEDAGPIIWLNNEEAGNKVMIRLYQAYFGVRLDQLLSNTRKYQEEFNRQVQGRFKLVDDANIHKSQVEKLLKQFQPSLVVYDQIDKVKGFDADREDLRLGAIYTWARELAKAYAPSIGVCQADGSGDGQKWLTMANVANAKTSKQAEADWILGIGATYAAGSETTRYLNLSKNKLQGDTDTVSNMRHGRTECLIEPNIARYRDIIKYT